MWYTLLNPTERRQILEQVARMWPNESESFLQKQYNYFFLQAETLRRKLVKSRTYRGEQIRGELASVAIWGTATAVLSNPVLSSITRYLAAGSLTDAIHYMFPFLMRRYRGWIQWLLFFAGVAGIIWAWSTVMQTSVMDVPELMKHALADTFNPHARPMRF